MSSEARRCLRWYGSVPLEPTRLHWRASCLARACVRLMITGLRWWKRSLTWNTCAPRETYGASKHLQTSRMRLKRTDISPTFRRKASSRTFLLTIELPLRTNTYLRVGGCVCDERHTVIRQARLGL